MASDRAEYIPITLSDLEAVEWPAFAGLEDWQWMAIWNWPREVQ